MKVWDVCKGELKTSAEARCPRWLIVMMMDTGKWLVDTWREFIIYARNPQFDPAISFPIVVNHYCRVRLLWKYIHYFELHSSFSLINLYFSLSVFFHFFCLFSHYLSFLLFLSVSLFLTPSLSVYFSVCWYFLLSVAPQYPLRCTFQSWTCHGQFPRRDLFPPMIREIKPPCNKKKLYGGGG